MKTIQLLTTVLLFSSVQFVNAKSSLFTSRASNLSAIDVASEGKVVPPPYLVTIFIKKTVSEGGHSQAFMVKSYMGFSSSEGYAEKAASESCLMDGNSAEECRPFYVTSQSLREGQISRETRN